MKMKDSKTLLLEYLASIRGASSAGSDAALTKRLMSASASRSKRETRSAKVGVGRPFPPPLGRKNSELRRGSPKRRRREGGGVAGCLSHLHDDSDSP
jgi:hypothetical protein